jgi:hypothetical protein
MFELSDDHKSSPLDPLLRRWHQWTSPVRRRVQHLLDLSVPHLTLRWVVAGVLLFLYALRVWLLEGYYMITYALSIYLLNRLMDFISPLEDPETDSVGPLPVTNTSDEEFKPFVRKLPEFKFWCVLRSAIRIISIISNFENYLLKLYD